MLSYHWIFGRFIPEHEFQICNTLEVSMELAGNIIIRFSRYLKWVGIFGVFFIDVRIYSSKINDSTFTSECELELRKCNNSIMIDVGGFKVNNWDVFVEIFDDILTNHLVRNSFFWSNVWGWYLFFVGYNILLNICGDGKLIHGHLICKTNQKQNLRFFSSRFELHYLHSIYFKRWTWQLISRVWFCIILRVIWIFIRY